MGRGCRCVTYASSLLVHSRGERLSDTSRIFNPTPNVACISKQPTASLAPFASPFALLRFVFSPTSLYKFLSASFSFSPLVFLLLSFNPSLLALCNRFAYIARFLVCSLPDAKEINEIRDVTSVSTMVCVAANRADWETPSQRF